MHCIADLFRDFFQYEQDTHGKVLAALNASSESARASEPFQMALNLLGHVTAARMIWLWRIGAVATRPESVSPKGLSLTRLAQEMTRMQLEWSRYLAGLEEEELSRTIEYTTLDGRAGRNRVHEILIQLHGHSLYHQGQVAIWLRQAGAEPARTDYILWARDAHG